MSVPDREQLIQAMADEMAASKCWSNRDSAEFDARVFFELAARLGYSVAPAESPAEAAVRPQERPEGSEATATAELAHLRQWQAQAIDLLRAAMPGSYTVQSLIRRAVAVATEETPI